MFYQIILLTILTLLPFFELRLSIPVGILAGALTLPFGITASGMNLNPLFVFVFVSVINILLGFLLFGAFTLFHNFLGNSKIGRRYERALNRGQKRIAPYIQKYGTFGLAIFIGIPLPGSGVYTGTLGAFVLGIKKRDFYIATILGVLIASTIVTILTLLGMNLF